MPSTINQRDSTKRIDLNSPPSGQVFERLEYFVQPKGMFATAQPQQAGVDEAIIAKNVNITDEGKFQIRHPLKRVFYDATVTPIGEIGLTDATGTGLLLLFHKAGIKWSSDGGSNWTDATGPALSAGPAIVLRNYAMWATTTLLFTTDAGNKIYTFNTTTKVYSEIATTLAAVVLTVFGGRAVISAGGTSTIYWSIKNDHTDFAGTGSGFESMRLSPGKSADDVIGLFPLNDTQMLIVRTGSVWMAELTGNVDVPFSFSFLYQVNLAGARSLAYSPEGVYALGLDDIYLLTIAGPEPIGSPIVGGWINSPDIIYNQYQAIAAYEPLRNTYYCYIPFTSASNIPLYLRGTDSGVASDERTTDTGEDRIADYPLVDPSLILAYNRKHKAWTYHSYNINVYNFSVVNFRTPAVKGLAFVTSDHQAFVTYRTDQALPNDGNDEYNYANALVAVEAQLLTGAIGPQPPSENVLINKVEVDLMSEAMTAQARRTLIYLYQTRSGPRDLPAGAVTFSDKTSTDSTGRNLHVARAVKSTKKFWQVDVRLQGCAGYIIHGLYIYAERGSEINE